MIFQNMKEEIKQIMQVKAQTERRFDTRDKFCKQSKIFQTDTKRFYWKIKKNQVMPRKYHVSTV